VENVHIHASKMKETLYILIPKYSRKNALFNELNTANTHLERLAAVKIMILSSFRYRYRPVTISDQRYS
jgi:hypothetical protein